MQLADRFTLYSFVDRDRSGRVRWTAHELGVPFEERRVEPGDHRHPDFLAVNPWGRIPAIVTGGQALAESGAICFWLAEQVPQAGLVVPSSDPERAAFLEWVFFACTTLEEAAYRVYFETAPRPADLDRLHGLLESVERHLSGVDHVVADRFTLADILTAYVIELCHRRRLLARYPFTVTYLERMAKRPAATRAGLFLGGRVDP